MWLYILLGVLLFFALILILPVKLIVIYSQDLKCVLSVLFIRIQLYPSKPEKTKKVKKESEDDEAKSKEDKPEKKSKKSFDWFINLIKKVSELAVGALKDFFEHIIIKKMMLNIKVVGDDAADTAVKFGYYCSAVYPAVGTVLRVVNCKDYGVDVYPDFAKDAKSEVAFELEAKIMLFWLIVLVVKHGIKGIKLLIDLKN